MTITITKKHLINTNFHHIRRDPLMAAIQEQAPHLQPKAVYEGFLTTHDHKCLEFDNLSKNGYSLQTVTELEDGSRKNIKVNIPDP